VGWVPGKAAMDPLEMAERLAAVADC
jgi:hypothetical protein